MNELVAAFAALPQTRRLVEALRTGAQRAAGGLWGASAALLLAALRLRAPRPQLVITASEDEAMALQGDLAAFGVLDAAVLPELEVDADGAPEPTSHGARVRTLAGVPGKVDFLLLAPLRALLQPVPSPRALARGRLRVRSGEPFDHADLLARAVAAGLRRVPLVLAPDEVSLRGDVLDVFPAASAEALRLEFFDGVLESIRTFDPATQRSLLKLDEALLPLGERGGTAAQGEVLDHLAARNLLCVRLEPLKLKDRQITLDAAALHALQRAQEVLATTTQLDLSALPSQDLDFRILSAGSAAGSGEADPRGRLRAIRGMAGRVVVVCRTAAEEARLREILAHRQVDLGAERLELAVGALSRGFRVPELDVALVSNTEFAGVPATVRVREKSAVPSKAVASFFELRPGDLVVHAVHGIARFEGMERVARGEVAEDCLRLLFADDVALLVPAAKIHLVQKYVGAGSAAPRLDRLGSKGFARRKEQVQQELFDLAADLLDVQARRERLRRPPYPRDPLEDAFLDGFPFQDTPDQVTAWAEIRADLEKEHPMDRLLCGDVGFGKTELALRAAFKVAITGRQVAVLAPTTVLAEQHQRVFAARMQAHGLRVDVLTRFRTAAERRAILADAGRGAIDILIGTHAILNEELRFARLGMLVVDEEQRFGVRQKERFKRLRTEVDVLTLSATPIPRTLHGSLLGLRPISTLTTPPPGRQDVDTRVLFRDASLVQEAVSRELARSGQVFYLHNEIRSLPRVARELQSLVPQARIAIGHGQMAENTMERTVRRFVGGEFDVLVSTTIVENGLDIPRANTILIDTADHFGLSELHQLRGRVGRSDAKAYCFLLMDREHPPPEAARRRLKALEEFSHLGAGFAIAMKDLEIRGAGNLLGPQQSGHIAAVGYEMYCQLLRTAVASARHETPSGPGELEVDVDLRIDAYLPESWLPDTAARLDLLREMDGAVTPEAAAEIGASLRDRFGALPEPVENLLQIFLLKHLLAPHGVSAVMFVGGDRLVVRHPPGQPLGGAWLDAFHDVRAVEATKTHLILPPQVPAAGTTPATDGKAVLAHLMDALLGRETARTILPRWRAPRSADLPSRSPSRRR
ncbi:MAG: DEAD/DEAH box helicase [Planctomycetes bacterium]|nr:DEAD/DEAH box helicase [Planctomycetota bacterium]